MAVACKAAAAPKAPSTLARIGFSTSCSFNVSDLKIRNHFNSIFCQAYGTAMARVRRMTHGYNPKLKTTSLVYRRKVEPLAAGVLQLAILGLLDNPPKDEDQVAAVPASGKTSLEAPCKARKEPCAQALTGSTTASSISKDEGRDSGVLTLPVELTSPHTRIRGENKSKLLQPGSRLEAVIRAVRERCSTDHPEWALDARPAHIEVLRPRWELLCWLSCQ